ncbi:MAG TPA: hypothetical protein VFP84_00580 [Kofleriaceae bacterium]|nr:hypothetical protein [Kofleriaceae bacterium]
MRWVACLALIAAACKRDAAGDDRARVPSSVPRIPAIDDRCDPRHDRLCIGDDVWACEASGTLGRRIQACHEGCEDGRCNATCADAGAGLIYVVDASDELRSFDPGKLPGDPFELIGPLRCRPQDSPFSMAIDRHGVGWVVYGGGELFKISISDASCRPTAFVPSVHFGMGFVTDGPGARTEKLFLAADDGSRALSYVDTAHDVVPHRVGVLTAGDAHNPELTGTSKGKLFGFFPVTDRPSFVQEIDRATGGPKGPRWPLGKAPLGNVNSYAFAQWGGVFYIFVTTIDDDGRVNSTVRAIDRATGTYRTVMENLPFRITGAGVSTCAPERDQ